MKNRFDRCELWQNIDVCRFVVVVGLSGAGRTVAAGQLEDLGWFVIDNVPAALIPKISELASSSAGEFERVALVMSAVDLQDTKAIADVRGELRDLTIVFLEASTETLLRRYKTTKRRHPYAADQGVIDAIAEERHILAAVKAEADVVIDTTDLNPYELNERIVGHFGDEKPNMQITLTSFGFKHGLPPDVDTVFDCRFMPNPYWEEELRKQKGTDVAVQAYVLTPERSKIFVERVTQMLLDLLPAYEREGKSYLTIGFGCTGGHHRSVTVVEHLAKALREHGWQFRVNHRDLAR